MIWKTDLFIMAAQDSSCFSKLPMHSYLENNKHSYHFLMY